MQRITIGRYKPSSLPVNVDLQNGEKTVIDAASLYDGWVSGVRDDGTSWIMWIDAHGSPEVFYPIRDEDGGVVGHGVELGPCERDPIFPPEVADWKIVHLAED